HTGHRRAGFCPFPLAPVFIIFSCESIAGFRPPHLRLVLERVESRCRRGHDRPHRTAPSDHPPINEAPGQLPVISGSEDSAGSSLPFFSLFHFQEDSACDGCDRHPRAGNGPRPRLSCKRSNGANARQSASASSAIRWWFAATRMTTPSRSPTTAREPCPR